MVSFAISAQSSTFGQVYYKWYYKANYGTSDYDGSPWVVVQDYSTNATCNYIFPSAGSYIIVVRAVLDPNNEPAVLPIIGAVVSVGQNSHVALTGLTSNSSGYIYSNTPVIFHLSNSCSTTVSQYYKWFYRANYGTSDYDSSPWVVVQNYSMNNSCNFSFPAAGNYIVVVRAVTDPNNEPADLPIFGTVVSVH